MSYHKLKDLIAEGKLGIGSVVYFIENTHYQIPYLLVNQGYGYGDNRKENAIVFMRQYADPSVSVSFFEDATNNEDRQYEGNTLDSHLSQTHFNKLTSGVRNSIVPVTILSVDRYGKRKLISRSVFAPSATEVGFGPMDGCNPVEGSTFAYFNDTNAKSRRVFRDSASGDTYEWNTRTRNCGDGVFDPRFCIGVKTDGDYEKGRWQINPKAVRPVFCISEESTIQYSATTSVSSGNLTPVSEKYYAIGNMPPIAPAVISSPSEVMSNNPFSIEWEETANGENDIDKATAPKYQLQLKKDDGEWEDVVSSTSLTGYSDSVAYNDAEKVSYRVRAIDNYSNYSEWVEFPEIDVINNVAPEAPSFINVVGQFTESPIAVSWGTSTDSDYNLSGYRLYRSADGGDFELIYEGVNTSFNEVSGAWDTVAYKVCAYDSYGYESVYTQTEKNLVAKCTIKLSVNDESTFADDKAISDYPYNEGVASAIYNLEDIAEGLTYIVSLAIDGKEFMTIEDVTVGVVKFDIPFDVWQKWLNCEHVLSVTATDPEGNSTSLESAFTKAANSLKISMSEPIVMEEPAKRFMLAVNGFFPDGVDVAVTNNANDGIPEWQSLTEEQYNGKNYVDFENTNISNGFAFNFSITANTAECNGYLSSISGIVGENLFELVLAKIEDLEERVSAIE